MSTPTIINLDPNTLTSNQTTFDGSVAPLRGSGPLQPGQEYEPGYDSAGLPFIQAFQNANTSQISTWFGQIQAFIEANPGMAALLGLGVLIMAANSGKRR